MFVFPRALVTRLVDLAYTREALRDVKAVVVPDDDYLTLVAAEDTIAAADSKRKKELDDLHTNLKGGAFHTA